jgi:anthranilate/para-aminobenzoate synthase component II
MTLIADRRRIQPQPVKEPTTLFSLTYPLLWLGCGQKQVNGIAPIVIYNDTAWSIVAEALTQVDYVVLSPGPGTHSTVCMF